MNATRNVFARLFYAHVYIISVNQQRTEQKFNMPNFIHDWHIIPNHPSVHNHRPKVNHTLARPTLLPVVE
jgi:hypothetical protein